jgi:hypothetical protein
LYAAQAMQQQKRQAPTQQQKQARSIHQQMQQQALRRSYQEQQQKQQQQEDQSFMLPSTMVPPSVLASMCGVSGSSKSVPARANSGKPVAKKKRPIKKTLPGEVIETPQSVLMDLLKQRRHSIPRIKADDVGYDAVPSALQLASFGTHLVRAVHTSDPGLLSELLECGLSPNPCNQFRDSIVDLVCKRANDSIFKCLLEHGCDLQVVDGFGRTPLHHASWASTFCRPIIESIMDVDPIQFFIEDKHGQTPLEYVRVDLYPDWIEFLQEMADHFWPRGGEAPQIHPPRDKRPEGILPDPKHAISTSLAALVSAGSMTPQQVMEMDPEKRKNYSKNTKAKK